MCNDAQDHLSRRSFLHGSAALAAGAVLPGRSLPQSSSRRRLPSASRPLSAGGNSAYSMAMHVHSSFSEFSGSMDAQLYQATATGVDVLWWSEHDGRLNGLNYRDVVHFTSLDGEKGATGQGGTWKWQPQSSGALASHGGGIVQSPCSPEDPVDAGALHVMAKSPARGETGKYGYYANSQTASYNYHCSVQGQTISTDVLASPGWALGYLELLVSSSYHDASAGRAAGFYSLSYQVKPGAAAPSSAQGNEGIVHLSVPADGNWHTVTVTPEDDLAAIFPDLDARDFAVYGITLSAVSTGGKVNGYFDYLRFDRTMSGEMALSNQASMMEALAGRYPSVSQEQGLEISQTSGTTHVNWFGPGVTVDQYEQMSPAAWNAWLAGTAIPQIHQAGALASYNHPYGVGRQALMSPSQQDAMLAQVATSLLSNDVLGADLLEVGYVQRGGMDLAHHAGLWDVLSRNAVFLTGNGVNDDHYGQDWLNGSQTEGNNWATSVWAASGARPALLAALAAGQAWCGSLSGFASGSALDLSVDGSCPMGSVSLASLTSRQLTLTCTGLPSGGSIQVLQGTVDYAGTADPSPDTAVVASYDTTSLDRNGQATVALDTTDECFARTQVLDSAGTVVALSNPVWMLQNTPPGGIPQPRRA